MLKLILVWCLWAYLAGVMPKFSKQECPRKKRTCFCDLLKKSVTCKRINKLPEVLLGLPKNTTTLEIAYSDLKKLDPDSFVSYVSLTDLKLNKNNLYEIASFAFFNLVNLKNLSLAENRLRFIHERVFESLYNLRSLNLSHNLLIVLAPRNFVKLHNLKYLDLRNNPTACMAPHAFRGLKRLENLLLSNMYARLSNHHLKNNVALKHLLLRSIRNLDSIPNEFLQQNPNLQTVRFEYLISLQNSGIPKHLFVGQVKLEALSFSACNLSRVPSSSLRFIKASLLSLDLSKNLFTCIKNSDLSFLKELQSLNLKQTGLHTIGSGALAIKSLRIVNLAGNRLRGLKEAAFGEAFPSSLQSVILGNNPLICDCELGWIAQIDILQHSNIPAVCFEPPAAQGRDIRFAYVRQYRRNIFECKAPNITDFGMYRNTTFIVQWNNHSTSLPLNCVATGYPKPVIYWIKLDPNSTTDLRSDQVGSSMYGVQKSRKDSLCAESKAISQNQLNVLDNGTLIVTQLSPKKATGKYVCVAENRFGIAQKRLEIVYDNANSSKEKVTSALKQNLSSEFLTELRSEKMNLQVTKNTETSYFSTFRIIEKLGSSKRQVQFLPNQTRKILAYFKKHSHSDVNLRRKKNFKISFLSSPASKSHNLGNTKHDVKLYQFCVLCAFMVIIL